MHALAVGATLLTLVTTHAPISAVAQDGARIAWASRTGIYTEVVPGGHATRLSTAAGATELAVAGDRVEWVAAGRIAFAAVRGSIAVPAPASYPGRITGLVGRGSVLGFTVVANTTDPGSCDEDDVCTGSMTAAAAGYVVHGSTIAALGSGVQPRTLLPPPPAQPALRQVRVPAGAQVYPTSRGAVVVAGRRLFVVTPRAPRLTPVGATSGRAAGFTVDGARLVWAETLDARHGRVRAVAVH